MSNVGDADGDQFLGVAWAPREQAQARSARIQLLVRVSRVRGASRQIEPEALARLAGWKATLEELAPDTRRFY